MAPQALDYDPDQMLTTEEAAPLCGYAESTMKLNRHLKRGPKFIKLGDGKNAAVRYRRGDIDAWLTERTFASTAEYSAVARHSQSRARNSIPARTSHVTPPWLRPTV